MEEPSKIIPTRKEAAWILGVTVRTLGEWKLQPDFPDCAKGYDIQAIRDWREVNQKKGSETDQHLATINKAYKLEKLKEARLKNELQQIEIDKANRELIPYDVVRQLMLELGGLIRSLGKQLQQSGNVTAARMIDEQMDRFRKIVHDRLDSSPQ